MSRGAVVSGARRGMKGCQKKGKGKNYYPQKENKPKGMVEIVHSGPSSLAWAQGKSSEICHTCQQRHSVEVFL